MSAVFAALSEGDELPALALTPDLGQVIRYCALSWVFPAMFYDIDAARAQGMPGTIVPGPLKLGYIYRAVEEWLGGAGFVRHVRCAHRRPNISGQPITVTGRVARVYDEDGHHRADIELAILDHSGQPTVRGFASVQFNA